MAIELKPANSPSVDPGRCQCPRPQGDDPQIILGHGGGGKLSAELLEQIFLPAFANSALAELGDATVVDLPPGRLACSTDSYVVQPLFFPGGSIGDLAVNGTVNDLAMSGARPLYLTAGFILEEGFPLAQLQTIARDMGNAARQAGVSIVAGDTKVVERGHGDGCYINTAGFGVVPTGVKIGPQRAAPGDAVLVSGTLGDHGMAIMSVRENLACEAPLRSDTAALHKMVAGLLEAAPEVHVLRDPTRGGLAATLNEIAQRSKCGILIDEQTIPVDPVVQAACEILGLDPLMVANEGKLVCVLPAAAAPRALAALRAHPAGERAAIIGHIGADHPTLVAARTALGATRVITLPFGEQLPRIC